jgi:catechol 2,3-dioxygenase-like lactoylglutathione lyase family enzyme
MSNFHLSLDVTDLPRSVEFFRLLLGCEPAKLKPDYAKFEPGEPAVVLSLEKRDKLVTGRLNHAGIRVGTAEELVAIQRRLEEGGVRTRRENGVECCYAKQSKFWATDPDGTLWEVYVMEGDIQHRGKDRLPLAIAKTGESCCG